jgi:uncharacterized protein YqeY
MDMTKDEYDEMQRRELINKMKKCLGILEQYMIDGRMDTDVSEASDDLQWYARQLDEMIGADYVAWENGETRDAIQDSYR